MSAIKVVDYDPSWPAAFAAERAGIFSLIGDFVEDIHHIGSTSVPGLAAKPKIDIDAVLRSGDFLPEAIERVKAAGGYAFHGDPYGDGMWTFTQGRGSYGTRLYLCGPGNATHIKRVLFRDWLRAIPMTPPITPRSSAGWPPKRTATGISTRAGKSEFVAEIVRRAAKRRAASPCLPASSPVRTGRGTKLRQRRRLLSPFMRERVRAAGQLPPPKGARGLEPPTPLRSCPSAPKAWRTPHWRRARHPRPFPSARPAAAAP